MNLLEYFVLPLISLIVLFLLTKLMGYRQVTELSLYDYIIGITIGSIAAEMVMGSFNDSFCFNKKVFKFSLFC